LIALILLFFLFPVFLAISVVIKIDSSGPVIFKQKRIGQYGKIFTIYKFRTMYKKAPYYMVKGVEQEKIQKWITPVGKLLRKSCLDELPQLFNILFGQMNFIGFRPEVINKEIAHALRES
jgi:O-antigen biosynthesis protein WbqP